MTYTIDRVLYIYKDMTNAEAASTESLVNFINRYNDKVISNSTLIHSDDDLIISAVQTGEDTLSIVYGYNSQQSLYKEDITFSIIPDEDFDESDPRTVEQNKIELQRDNQLLINLNHKVETILSIEQISETKLFVSYQDINSNIHIAFIDPSEDFKDNIIDNINEIILTTLVDGKVVILYKDDNDYLNQIIAGITDDNAILKESDTAITKVDTNTKVSCDQINRAFIINYIKDNNLYIAIYNLDNNFMLEKSIIVAENVDIETEAKCFYTDAADKMLVIYNNEYLYGAIVTIDEENNNITIDRNLLNMNKYKDYLINPNIIDDFYLNIQEGYLSYQTRKINVLPHYVIEDYPEHTHMSFGDVQAAGYSNQIMWLNQQNTYSQEIGGLN